MVLFLKLRGESTFGNCKTLPTVHSQSKCGRFTSDEHCVKNAQENSKREEMRWGRRKPVGKRSHS